MAESEHATAELCDHHQPDNCTRDMAPMPVMCGKRHCEVRPLYKRVGTMPALFGWLRRLVLSRVENDNEAYVHIGE